jgi:hypothetical protein
MEKSSKKAIKWTIISYIPFIGPLWWTFKVNRHIAKEESK